MFCFVFGAVSAFASDTSCDAFWARGYVKNESGSCVCPGTVSERIEKGLTVSLCTSIIQEAAEDGTPGPFRHHYFNSGVLVDETDGSNEAAQMQASEVNRLGSAAANTVAIGVCAQGANKLPKDKVVGGVIVGSCLEAIDAAAKLKEQQLLALKNLGQDGGPVTLEVDEAALKDSSLQKELEKVRENYKIEPGEFVDGVLKTKGNRRAFGRLLKEKFSSSEFFDAMEMAEKISPKQRGKILAEVKELSAKRKLDFAVSPGGARPPASALRDSLYESLHSKSVVSEVRKPASSYDEFDQVEYSGKSGRLSRPSPGLEQIRALEESALLDKSLEAPEGELTLFDVVHRKYRDKEMHRRLINSVLTGRF